MAILSGISRRAKVGILHLRIWVLRIRMGVYLMLMIRASDQGNYLRKAHWLCKMIALYEEDDPNRRHLEKDLEETQRRAKIQSESKLKKVAKEIRLFDDYRAAGKNSAYRAKAGDDDPADEMDRSRSSFPQPLFQGIGVAAYSLRFLFYMHMVERAKLRGNRIAEAHWLKKCIRLSNSVDRAAVVVKVLYDDLARVLTDLGQHSEAEEARELARKAQGEMECENGV